MYQDSGNSQTYPGTENVCENGKVRNDVLRVLRIKRILSSVCGFTTLQGLH